MSAISLRSNEPNAPSNVRVLKATKQVVSGMMYTLELELKFTDCQRDGESCIRRQKCSVSIWEQPWLGKREVTKLTCNDVKTETALALKSSLSRRHLVGGITPADPLSKEIKAHAAFALTAIQSQSNARNLLNIVRIRNAGTQTVSGKKIYLTIEVGQTTCDRLVAYNLNDRECPFDPSADRQLCKVEIWTQPWLNERQITNLKCAALRATNKKCTAKTCKRSRRSTEDVPNTHSHHHHHHHSKNLKKTRRLKHMTAFRNYAKEFNKSYKTWGDFEHRYKIFRYFANSQCIFVQDFSDILTGHLELTRKRFNCLIDTKWERQCMETHLSQIGAQLNIKHIWRVLDQCSDSHMLDFVKPPFPKLIFQMNLIGVIIA